MITDWVEVAVTVTPETEEAISNALCELGSNGVVLTDPAHASGVVSGYLPAGGPIQEKLRAIRLLWNDLCKLGLAAGDCRMAVRSLPASDWTTGWQARFSPVRVTDRLVITPPWAPVPREAGRLVIEIVPGLAFGTGEHETTQLCLRALEQQVRTGDRVLDMGAGSGVLSITSALLGAREVIALDVDDVAVDSARENVRRNGVDDRIAVYHGSSDHPSITGLFRVIVSNTDARTLHGLVASLCRLLDRDGVLILSGVLNEERDTLVRRLADHALAVTHETTQGEWWAGVAVKRTA